VLVVVLATPKQQQACMFRQRKKEKTVVLSQVFVKSGHIQVLNKPLEKTLFLVMGLTSLPKRENLLLWLTFTLEILIKKN